jgi:hypothetical protein
MNFCLTIRFQSERVCKRSASEVNYGIIPFEFLRSREQQHYHPTAEFVKLDQSAAPTDEFFNDEQFEQFQFILVIKQLILLQQFVVLVELFFQFVVFGKLVKYDGASWTTILELFFESVALCEW